MKRNVLVFGSILGLILVVNMFVMVDQIRNNPNLETNDVIGYAAMVVVMSITFFGIRNYRNNRLNGTISFWRALKVGALIVLMASTMYVVAWLFYYYLFVPDFIDKYTTFVLNDATKSGATPVELASKTEEMVQFKEMYKNPLFVIFITYVEVFPIGLVVALVSALVLRKKSQI